MKTMSIIGRVGRDVSVKQNGELKICSFPVAVNEKVKGEKTTEWIDVTTFGKAAEVCEKYVSKGSKIFCSGNFKIDKYTTKDGQDRVNVILNASIIEMLDSKKESDEPTRQFADDEVPF